MQSALPGWWHHVWGVLDMLENHHSIICREVGGARKSACIQIRQWYSPCLNKPSFKSFQWPFVKPIDSPAIQGEPMHSNAHLFNSFVWVLPASLNLKITSLLHLFTTWHFMLNYNKEYTIILIQAQDKSLSFHLVFLSHLLHVRKIPLLFMLFAGLQASILIVESGCFLASAAGSEWFKC